MNTPIQAEHARTRALEALEQGDAERAWHELEALDPELDIRTAGLWLDLLRVSPRRERLEADVLRVLARWPGDAQLVTRACDALIRRAELAPPDEPSPERERLAKAAASAAEQCLGLGSHPEAAELRGFLLAARGNALRLLGDYPAAQQSVEAALREDPERGGFWFNLGLVHKASGAWRQALEANQQARARLGDERGPLWNIAICATALGEGAVAVEALRALGQPAELSVSGMPYVPGLPPVCVRAATVGSGVGSSAVPDRSIGLELLWVTPLSPCHGVVSSPSFRDASTDYGDLVLWDGVPVGASRHEGRLVPRFPLLAVLRKGDEHRIRFVALQQAADQVAALAKELGPGAHLFIHGERIESFCARCASGEAMLKHTHEAPQEHRLVQGKLVLDAATDVTEFRKRLDELLRGHSGVQLVAPRLLELAGDTAAAGIAHRLWRALTKPSAVN